jgi:AraC-like DNA-binding protein
MSENSQLGLPPAGVETHAAGELIERHRHDYDQLIYVSTGVLAIDTDAGAWVGSRDRAVWIPAGTWHQHRAYGATSVTTIGFTAGDVSPLAGSPTVVTVDGLLRELLLAYTDPELRPDESGRMWLVLRDRLSRARVRPLTLPAARDPRLAEACELVAADLRRPRTLAWLAGQVGAGERTLNRLFRREAAHACGWATASAFIDTFARTMGQTPGAYRRPSS